MPLGKTRLNRRCIAAVRSHSYLVGMSKSLTLARLILLSLGLCLGATSPAPAQTVHAQHLHVQLIAQSTSVTPGATIFLAIHQKIEKGWHTYWRNPGDAGAATEVNWTLPKGWKAGAIVWPRPEAIRVGPLLDYAYHDDVVLPVPIEVPASARPGTSVTVKAAASFLVCKETCIPANADLELNLPISADTPKPDPRWGSVIAETLASAPKSVGLKAQFARHDQTLVLKIEAPPGLDQARSAYFFPYSGSVLSHPAPQKVTKASSGLVFELVSAPTQAGGSDLKSLDGVLALDDQSYEISAIPGAVVANTGGQVLLNGAGDRPQTSGIGLLKSMMFAMLGGLILNLMPCVFPILSLKAASLIGEAQHPARLRMQGLAFTLGTIVTFLSLAGLLIALRAGGEALGWGFHLQSPIVVGALSLLIVGLNMSGVFEVGTSLQGIGSSAPSQGAAGAFMTGVLAVSVAAPCTAPFMGAALGFALTQPTLPALAVFLALALGFSAPFLAIALFPRLLARMPRPGAWMERLRHALAFPMYATAAWLVWVYSQQGSSVGLGALLAAIVVMAMAAWLWGQSQLAVTLGKTGRVTLGAAGLTAALSVGILLLGANQSQASSPAAPVLAEGSALASEPWSAERIRELQAEGKPVLVDFTAAWCVTCQVNEKTALASPKVLKTFKDLGAVYLKADWTNRDPLIAAELEQHGRVGVPLYLVYAPSREQPVILPQLLTAGMVMEALEAAKR
jgi:thiol:disulfide interchange protein